MLGPSWVKAENESTMISILNEELEKNTHCLKPINWH